MYVYVFWFECCRISKAVSYNMYSVLYDRFSKHPEDIKYNGACRIANLLIKLNNCNIQIFL